MAPHNPWAGVTTPKDIEEIIDLPKNQQRAIRGARAMLLALDKEIGGIPASQAGACITFMVSVFASIAGQHKEDAKVLAEHFHKAVISQLDRMDSPSSVHIKVTRR